jgi:hypothetical protein
MSHKRMGAMLTIGRSACRRPESDKQRHPPIDSPRLDKQRPESPSTVDRNVRGFRLRFFSLSDDAGQLTMTGFKNPISVASANVNPFRAVYCQSNDKNEPAEK